MLISLAMSLAGADTAALPAVSAEPDCANILQIRESPARSRAIEEQDLIETLDIGSNGAMEDLPAFAVAPDRQRIAIAVRRADLRTNGYCSGIYLTDGRGNARLIDSGIGASFWRYENFHGTNGFPSGITKVITPRWSPDGRYLAFLKSVRGRLQLWLWDERHDSRALAIEADEIVDFHFSTDGKSIIYKAVERQRQNEALARESLRGFRLDDRFFPFASSTPFPLGTLAYTYRSVRTEDGTMQPATSAQFDQNMLAAANPSRVPRQRGDLASDVTANLLVHVDKQGREKSCQSDLCTDVQGSPWTSSAGHVRFMRREGWGRSLTSIYEWKANSERPTRLFQTADILSSCTPVGEDILCVRESAIRPRYLDRIGLRTKESSLIFDPNPSYAGLRLGRIQRLQWSNDRGVECFGDLVYPPHFNPGQRYPLIITQYESRGFLRGGTGDEFPIQLFAKAGYLVLNIQRPRAPAPTRNTGASIAVQQQDDILADRHSVLSMIETMLSHLVQAGLVDADKVGITGLSDGSTTTQFAALHSSRFKAGSVSGCCWEPSQSWLLGPAIQRQYAAAGWPPAADANSRLWKEMSLARNADRVAFPILMQAADGEFLAALESFQALRAVQLPVDLYVYPDELHVKRYPVHRLNIYRRNLRWFDFWLRDKIPETDDDEAEAANWVAMREIWRKRR